MRKFFGRWEEEEVGRGVLRGMRLRGGKRWDRRGNGNREVGFCWMRGTSMQHLCYPTKGGLVKSERQWMTGRRTLILKE